MVSALRSLSSRHHPVARAAQPHRARMSARGAKAPYGASTTGQTNYTAHNTPKTSANTSHFSGCGYDGAQGEVLDLWYFRARYFDSELGRFISRDPLTYVDGMSMYRGYFIPGGMDPSGKLGVAVIPRESSQLQYSVIPDAQMDAMGLFHDDFDVDCHCHPSDCCDPEDHTNQYGDLENYTVYCNVVVRFHATLRQSVANHPVDGPETYGHEQDHHRQAVEGIDEFFREKLLPLEDAERNKCLGESLCNARASLTEELMREEWDRYMIRVVGHHDDPTNPIEGGPGEHEGIPPIDGSFPGAGPVPLPGWVNQ